MTSSAKPLPQPDLDSRPYWDAARRHKLTLPRCQRCDHTSFPPRPRCSRCLSQELVWVEMSGRGVVHSFCVMHDDLIQGFQPPYVIAHVELEEQTGLLLTVNILDCPVDQVRIGMPVEVAFKEVTEEVSLPQFRPMRV